MLSHRFPLLCPALQSGKGLQWAAEPVAVAWAPHDAHGAGSALAHPSTAQGWSLNSSQHFGPGASSWDILGRRYPEKVTSHLGLVPACG